MSPRPSWAAPVPDRPTGASPSSVRAIGRPPATLLLAALGVAFLAAAEAVHVARRDELRPALRVALIAGIAMQAPCAALALRRSPAAAMLLLLCASTALVASLASGAFALAGIAAVVVVLLGASLHWFPTADPWSS